jgi:RIO kinase 1
MSRLTDWNDYDNLEDLEDALNIRNLPTRERNSRKKARPNHQPKVSAQAVVTDIAGAPGHFEISYDATRHERVWIEQALETFFDSQWLDDVLRLVKGGKEANVYQCQANPSVPDLMQAGWEAPYLAAKIYRPRQFRNLRKDHMYREGRVNLDENGKPVNDDGMLHAMAKRTEYGKELLHTSWIEHEFTTLQVLHAAGADVPRPLASGSNAILMAYVGDDEAPAPTLNSIRLEREEAPRLFERVVHNIDLMLAHNRVHADLSAYNILYWDGEITLIDFPQAINPHENRNGYAIFERDVVRVCEYFARQGVRSQPRRLAADLWRKHRYPTTPDIHPRLLDPDDDRDRRMWQSR